MGISVTVQYTGQLAGITGTAEEKVDWQEGWSLLQLIQNLSSRHGPNFSDLVLKEDRSVRPSLLVIVNGEQAEQIGEAMDPAEIQTVMLMTPIAGG